MAKYKPGDRVKKQIKRVPVPETPEGQAYRGYLSVTNEWIMGEVLACGRRGHITVRWDGDSKLEALDSARVRPV